MPDAESTDDTERTLMKKSIERQDTTANQLKEHGLRIVMNCNRAKLQNTILRTSLAVVSLPYPPEEHTTCLQ